MKSLINLKNFGSTFGLGGEISPIAPPWLRAWPGQIPEGHRSWSVVTFAVAGVTVKLLFPTSSMIMLTMHLSGSNRNNLQVQAALSAVTDITKGSVWIIIAYCFFAVGSVKILQLTFVIFVGEELAEIGFVRQECQNNFENHCSKPQPM